MNRSHFLFLLALVTIPSLAWGRTWTSSDGRKMEADFVDATEETVTLKKDDGKQTTFKLERLSEDDQRFVRAILIRRKGTKTTITEDPIATPTPKPAANKIPKFGASDEEEAGDDADNPFRESSDSSDSDATDGSAGKKRPKIENRTWTDAFGRKSSGKFIRFQGNNVVVLRSGRQAVFNYWELSSTDQDYLKELCEGFGQSHLIPKVNPASVANSTTTPGAAVPYATPAVGTTAPPMTATNTTTSRPIPPQTADPEELARKLREIQNNPAPTYTPPATITMPPATTYMPPMTTYTPPMSTYTPPMTSSPPPTTYTPPPMSTYTPPPTTYNPTTPVMPASAMPSSTFTPPPTMDFGAKQCENCNKVLPASFTAGDTCPGCGVTFTVDRTNGKTASGGGFGGGGGGMSRGAIRGVIVLVVLAVKAVAFIAWRSQQS